MSTPVYSATWASPVRTTSVTFISSYWTSFTRASPIAKVAQLTDGFDAATLFIAVRI